MPKGKSLCLHDSNFDYKICYLLILIDSNLYNKKSDHINKVIYLMNNLGYYSSTQYKIFKEINYNILLI